MPATPVVLSKRELACFPVTYALAQSRWLEGLAANIELVKHHLKFPVGAQGPQYEELTTRVAWLGHEDASKVLVLIAGTNGVEGHVGSAVQLDLWSRLEQGKLTLQEEDTIMAVLPFNHRTLARQSRCHA